METQKSHENTRFDFDKPRFGGSEAIGLVEKLNAFIDQPPIILYNWRLRKFRFRLNLNIENR